MNATGMYVKRRKAFEGIVTPEDAQAIDVAVGIVAASDDNLASQRGFRSLPDGGKLLASASYGGRVNYGDGARRIRMILNPLVDRRGPSILS